MSNDNLQETMKHFHYHFRNCKKIVKLVEPLSRNRDPNITQNEHFYAICYWLEVDDDVISGWNIKTTQGYAVVKFEAAIFSIS